MRADGRWILSNGLRVNTKRRLTGRDSLPVDAPGVVELEIVTLGGKATATPALKGERVCMCLYDVNLANAYVCACERTCVCCASMCPVGRDVFPFAFVDL